jgi:hypothetical protein
MKLLRFVGSVLLLVVAAAVWGWISKEEAHDGDK